MNKKLLSTMVGVALVAAAGVAQADLKVELSLDKLVLFADDGLLKDTFIGDGGSKVKVKGSGEISPGLKAGASFEIQIQPNEVDQLSFADQGTDADKQFRAGNTDEIDLFVEGSWGRLSLGYGDDAGDLAGEADLSNTGTAQSSDMVDFTEKFQFRAKGNTNTLAPNGASNIELADVLDDLGPGDERNRIMYTTPELGGFTFAISYGVLDDGVNRFNSSGARVADPNDHEKTRGVGMNYEGDFGGVKLAAGLGWEKTTEAANVGGVAGVAAHSEVIGGSFSVLLPSGTNFTLFTSELDVEGSTSPKPKYTFVKLGQNMGKHAVSIAMGKGENQVSSNDEGKAIGLAYTARLAKWAEFYASHTIYSYDDSTTTEFEDFTATMAGLKLKF